MEDRNLAAQAVEGNDAARYIQILKVTYWLVRILVQIVFSSILTVNILNRVILKMGIELTRGVLFFSRNSEGGGGSPGWCTGK